MFSELRQVATEKFCNYVGENTCSNLSKYGSQAINGLSSPIVLATIAAIGLSTAIVIRWNWNTTVVKQAIKEEGLPPVLTHVAPAVMEEVPPLVPVEPAVPEAIVESTPEVPQVLIEPLPPLVPIELVAPEPITEIDPIAITLNCVDIPKPSSKFSRIIDKPKEWIKGALPYQILVQNRAPYLLDLTMEDGSPIPLEPGDYLVQMEFENIPWLKLNSIGICSDHFGRDGFQLPAKLVKCLRADQPLTLHYQTGGNRKAKIEIAISEELFKKMDSIIEELENLYFNLNRGLSDDPMRLDTSLASLEVPKSYPHPRDKMKKSGVELKAQLDEALKFPGEITHYRFSKNENRFQQVNQFDLTAINPSPLRISINQSAICAVVSEGDLTLSIWADNLLIHHNSHVPEFLAKQGLTEDQYLSGMKESNMPTEVGCLINLKAFDIEPGVIKANLERAVLKNGLFGIPL